MGGLATAGLATPASVPDSAGDPSRNARDHPSWLLPAAAGRFPVAGSVAEIQLAVKLDPQILCAHCKRCFRQVEAAPTKRRKEHKKMSKLATIVVLMIAVMASLTTPQAEAISMRGMPEVEDVTSRELATTCLKTCPENSVLKPEAADKECLVQYADCKCSLPTLGNGYCSGKVTTVQTGVYSAKCVQEKTPCTSTGSGGSSSGGTPPTAEEQECISTCPENSVRKTSAAGKACLNQQTDCTCSLPTLGNGYCSGRVTSVPTGVNTMRCEQEKTPCTTTAPTTKPPKCIKKCPKHSIRRPESASKTCLNQFEDCECQLPKAKNPLCVLAVKTILTGTNTAKCVQSKSCP
ncbi:Hypothetical Protein FCC1311_081452 [Hondaea fermentalgiana]|uniref:Uncharacterized protein n=1 Tax=Hondaea fermentalgiana TaxID=2315210 RepID=A0A2R5GM11_9STRA|nr:Hypothetical Protein FCC1311_081452 [Hondaea fermentalgiana]|eukprot:GBG31920.1 Hypothetical Protein FCC1311_081452 [Hondaea fermentalgiana]